MHPEFIEVGDVITESPVGHGMVTDFDGDYAMVNSQRVAWCRRSDGKEYNPLGIGGHKGDLKRQKDFTAEPTTAVNVPVGQIVDTDVMDTLANQTENTGVLVEDIEVEDTELYGGLSSEDEPPHTEPPEAGNTDSPADSGSSDSSSDSGSSSSSSDSGSSE